MADCTPLLGARTCKAVVSHAENVLRFTQIRATVQTENAASIRITERLGMSRQEYFDRDGREIAVYSRRFGQCPIESIWRELPAEAWMSQSVSATRRAN